MWLGKRLFTTEWMNEWYWNGSGSKHIKLNGSRSATLVKIIEPE